MRLLRSPLAFLVALLVTGGLAGCHLLGVDPTDVLPDDPASEGPAAEARRGTLRVLLTDAPFPYDLVESANVTITRVDVVGDSVFTVSADSQAFNLLDLRNGVTAALGEVELPAGSYRQVRLVVDDASVVLKDGQVFDLKIPSGAQTGIKVIFPGGVAVGDSVGTTEVTLDFRVDESFVVQGNPNSPAGIKGFLFKPVVKPIRVTLDGEEEEGYDEEEDGDAGEEEEGEEEEEDEGGDDDGEETGDDTTGDDTTGDDTGRGNGNGGGNGGGNGNGNGQGNGG